MNVHDYATRAQQRLERSSALPCEHCGHRLDEHRELKSTFEVVDGEIVETFHPDYRPGVFFCHHVGCDCEKIS